METLQTNPTLERLLTTPSFTYNIRNCYKARPGFKLVSIDYNNLELISCAWQLSRVYKDVGCRMKELINSGDKPTDLHSVYGAELMGRAEGRLITYDEFIANKKKAEYKAYRNKGKPMSLGRPGGMGYDTIRKQCASQGIVLPYQEKLVLSSEKKIKAAFFKYCRGKPNMRIRRIGKQKWAIVYDEVVGLRRALDELYPELNKFLSETHVRYQNGDKGGAYNEYGEWEVEPYYKFDVLGVKRDYCTYTAFCNGFLMQTPSAVGAKRATIDCFRWSENRDDVFPLSFIHDEILFEIKDDHNLLENTYKCAEIMIDSMQKKLQGLRVTVEWGINDFWDKDIQEQSGICFKSWGDDTLRHH